MFTLFKQKLRRFYQSYSMNISNKCNSNNNNQIYQTQLMLKYQTLVDQNLSLPKFQDTGFREFSQNDEDGLLLYIFSLIGSSNKKCLDVAYAGPKWS